MIDGSKKLVSIVTAATGDRVVVSEEAVLHIQDKHLPLPMFMVLEVIELVLKDPTDVFEQKLSENKFYHMFYRLEDGRSLVAVVKKLSTGCYLSSLYPTGRDMRSKHSSFKRIKV